jgi:hypothetical protein
MRNNEVLKNAVISRLISEGVSADNYTSLRAMSALTDCVRAKQLINYLRYNENDIIDGLSQIAQINATELPNIKQQYTATRSAESLWREYFGEVEAEEIRQQKEAAEKREEQLLKNGY